MKQGMHRYLSTAARLFGPLGEEDGLPEGVLAAAEARLRVTLPLALREVYLATGRREDLHASHHRLLPPDELALEGGALVFFEERARAALWGIPLEALGLEDPPVRVVARGEGQRGAPAEESLTCLLESVLHVQRLSVAPWVMKRKVGAALLEKLEALYPALEVGGGVGPRARWFGEGRLLVRVEGAPPSAIVTVAAPDAAVLLALGEALDLVWSDAVWAGPQVR